MIDKTQFKLFLKFLKYLLPYRKRQFLTADCRESTEKEQEGSRFAGEVLKKGGLKYAERRERVKKEEMVQAKADYVSQG